MPKLDKTADVEIKLDAAAGSLQNSLSAEQRCGLFEQPGTVIVAIAELTSKSYTGHAEGEEKDPQVKVRVTGAEVARSDEEAAALLEAKRAMWRARKVDGTLDEVGPGPRNAEHILDTAMAGYPSEGEYREHERAKTQRGRDEFVR